MFCTKQIIISEIRAYLTIVIKQKINDKYKENFNWYTHINNVLYYIYK